MRIHFYSKLSLLLLTLLYFSPTLIIQAQKVQALPPGNLQPVTQFGENKTQNPVIGRPATQVTPFKTNTVNPVAIGHGSNHYSNHIPMQNCLAADDSTGAVLFIHRTDPSQSGGTPTGLRYDISTNRGTTWATDIGVLNPIYVVGRQPQIALYSPPGSVSPTAGNVVFISENLDVSAYRGFEYGVNVPATSGPLATMQNALFLPTNKNVANGGFTEGRKGEYWAARFSFGGGVMTDSLHIYRAVLNTGTQTLSWSLQDVKIMPWSLTYDGEPHAIVPSVAFSPDGSVGWITMLGDLTAGPDSIFAPIVFKSTDGGNTWGTPQEIDLNSFGWIADSLQSLWVDSFGNSPSAGRATAAFEYDATVDGNGNLHMFFVVGSAAITNNPNPFYAIYPGLSKYGVDLMSVNQGASFDLRLVAPVLAFRGYLGVSPGFGQDNYPQVSRTHSGSHILFSWVDTDSIVAGFGNVDNIFPNLFIAGYRVSDGYFTCIHSVTEFDPVWDGKVYSAQMAPEVFVNPNSVSNSYNLPIVSNKWTSNDPNLAVTYHYFGADAELTDADFALPPGSSIAWTGCLPLLSATEPISNQVLIYPHPVVSQSRVEMRGWNGEPWTFELFDLQGRKLMGAQVHAATMDFQRGHLAAGAYVYRILGNGLNPVSGKMILE